MSSAMTLTAIPTPICHGMLELPSAAEERARLNRLLSSDSDDLDLDILPPESSHIAIGLALTTGSAVGERPPTREQCLEAFEVPNGVGLSAGARAWTKHAHRSGNVDISADTNEHDQDDEENEENEPGLQGADSESPNPKSNPKKEKSDSNSWWGKAQGPITSLNARALEIFERIMQNATWRNLHLLPHTVLVYEVRVREGYGMRWSQDRSPENSNSDSCERGRDRDWVFRGFVEPMMENGHELRWRH